VRRRGGAPAVFLDPDDTIVRDRRYARVASEVAPVTWHQVVELIVGADG